MILIILLSCLLAYVRAQSPGCDFNINVQSGYTVKSPNYPGSYPANIRCRWQVTCPVGYRCLLNCELYIPQSRDCSLDRLLISLTGDPKLLDARPYCGTGTFSVISAGEKISLGLVTVSNTPGGRFKCDVIPQKVEPTPPPSCTCGLRKTTRIVGGQDTKPNEFPMMVAVVKQNSANVMCGGVIISSQYVLTAAHCVYRLNPSIIAIVVGEHDISTGSDSPYTRAYRIADIRTHPGYIPPENGGVYDYDISVLRTAQLIEFNQYVGPACLPFKYASYDFTGEKVTILGWGTLYIGGQSPDKLQKVDVDVISQDRCAGLVRTLTPRQMCTYTPGKDACQMDSGGPLLYTDRRTGLLFHAGIVSSGSLCASEDKPGVNTRVTQLLNWIVQAAPDNYCEK